MDFPGVRHEFWGKIKMLDKIINDMPQFVQETSNFKEVHDYLQKVIQVIRENERNSAKVLREEALGLIQIEDMDED